MPRIFMSIDIPYDTKRKIKQIQEKLPEFIGKKTETENLHLTLKFLGEIDEKKIDEVRKKLREVKINKFETEIDFIGVFSETFIRIIWLHLTNCDELQKEIDEKLSNLFRKEDRFMSHLTIARIKKIKNKKEFLEKIKKIKIQKIKFPITCFKLKESILTENGPIYKDIEVYPLK